jgi:hypothetical protein
MNTIEKNYVTKLDKQLPCIYPFTGVLTNTKFKQLCEILCECFQNKSLKIKNHIKFIKDSMLNTKLAPITSKNRTYVDVLKRMCLRYTFDKVIVKKISELILEDIKNRARQLYIAPDDIIIDPTHGDILYYYKDCFFNNHRDAVLKQPDEIKHEGGLWRMYSILIGLDSNINHSEGETTIYLPSLSFLDNDDNKISFLDRSHEKILLKHVFKESCIPANYLIFPSEALHGSTKICTDNCYKLTLKLDAWIKIPIANLQNILYTRLCDCLLCNSGKPLVNSFVNELKNYLVFDDGILKIISEYCIYCDKRDECIANEYCQCKCTCAKCVTLLSCRCSKSYRNYVLKNKMDSDDSYSSEAFEGTPSLTSEDICNGYENY